jgi:hypothetical protein
VSVARHSTRTSLVQNSATQRASTQALQAGGRPKKAPAHELWHRAIVATTIDVDPITIVTCFTEPNDSIAAATIWIGATRHADDLTS